MSSHCNVLKSVLHMWGNSVSFWRHFMLHLETWNILLADIFDISILHTCYNILILVLDTLLVSHLSVVECFDYAEIFFFVDWVITWFSTSRENKWCKNLIWCTESVLINIYGKLSTEFFFSLHIEFCNYDSESSSHKHCCTEKEII